MLYSYNHKTFVYSIIKSNKCHKGLQSRRDETVLTDLFQRLFVCFI